MTGTKRGCSSNLSSVMIVQDFETEHLGRFLGGVGEGCVKGDVVVLGESSSGYVCESLMPNVVPAELRSVMRIPEPSRKVESAEEFTFMAPSVESTVPPKTD